MNFKDIFRSDQPVDTVLRTVAHWDALPLALIIGAFFFVSSAGALAWSNWYLKPRRQIIVTVFGIEALLSFTVTVFLAAVFFIHSYALMPRSTVSLCELTSIRMKSVTSALDNYYSAKKSFPTGADWGKELTVPELWPSSEIPSVPFYDGSGIPLRLETDGFTGALRSAGPDRGLDSRDDYLCEKKIDLKTGALALTWNCVPEGISIEQSGCLWK